MIKAGATRIGASAGVKIIQGPSGQLVSGMAAVRHLQRVTRSANMLIAKVIGTTVSTIKDEKLEGTQAADPASNR